MVQSSTDALPSSITCTDSRQRGPHKVLETDPNPGTSSSRRPGKPYLTLLEYASARSPDAQPRRGHLVLGAASDLAAAELEYEDEENKRNREEERERDLTRRRIESSRGEVTGRGGRGGRG
eukprot:754563-Hanusia_phi.AAC.3